jgi:hypothetical protein
MKQKAHPVVVKPKKAWRNRIVGYGEADPKTLTANPTNWRVHGNFQKSSMGGILSEVGLVQNIIVNRVTGRILDGHMRVELAIEEGQPKVPITYVELTEAEEAKMLASLDSITMFADQDGKMFDETLALAGSGSDPALAMFLEAMRNESGMTSATAGEGAKDRVPHDQQRERGIKAVVFAEQVAVFEAALRATGEANRGTALIQICQEFLNSHADQSAAGQLDFPPESPA